MEKSTLITRSQAAELLKVSARTLIRWEQTGKIVVRRHPMNNYRLYNKQDIQDLANEINGMEMKI